MILILNNIKEFLTSSKKEILKSIILSFLIIVILDYLEIYNDFSYYESGLQEILICFIGGYIGLLAFSLSGIAIITGLFNRSHLEFINKDNNKRFEKITKSYQSLTTISGILIFVLTIIYLYLLSPKELVNIKMFLIIESILLFLISFSIIYTIELVKMTIRLYNIKNTYDKAIETSNNFRSDINEIRIDVLFRIIMNEYNITIEELILEIENSIENSNYTNKEQLKKYIRSKYQ